MANRPALITQADVRRIVAGAKAAGATQVEIPTPAGNVIVHLTPSGERTEIKRPISL